MERTLVRNTVAFKRALILQLLSRPNESLLVPRDACFPLNIVLDLGDAIGRMKFEHDRIPFEKFDEYLQCSFSTP